MVLEWVVADPWHVLNCLSCSVRISIPPMGPTRNLAPVICPMCGQWFACPSVTQVEEVQKVRLPLGLHLIFNRR